MKEKKSYGLFTTVAMIVGIVIGSGIYFKADDIFKYTNGNLILGLIVLTLSAICIIFGSLSLAQLSKRCDDRGGLVAYFDKFFNKKMASGFGWFQLFVYTPTITAVIGWVAAIYTFMLFGKDATLIQQLSLGIAYIIILFILNVLKKAWGGYLQNVATAVKIIPLLIIAVYGIFFANPVSLTSVDGTSFAHEFTKFSWLTALVPLAYSYDGWTIALHIAPEVKNPKVNVSKALILSPLFILIIYLLYIFGIAKVLGSKAILEMGDSAVFEASKMILGEKLGNIILVIIVIAVLGVLNGVILGGIRMPQALAEKQMIPDKHEISKISEKFGISVKSAFVLLALVIFWTIIHFFVMQYNLLGGRDISEIAIVFSYLSYILLYFAVWKVLKDDKIKRILPVFATIGSLIILTGSLIASPIYVSAFIIFCALVMLIGYKYYKV